MSQSKTVELKDLVRTVAPAKPVIELEEAKVHLNLEAEDTERDGAVLHYIAAATAHLDGYDGILGRCLVNQTWAYHLPAFPCGRELELPLPPLVSVGSITYFDAAGASQTFSSALYAVLDGPLSMVELVDGQSWPATQSRRRAVTVTYTAGYGATGEAVPADIRNAMFLLIGHWFENREAVVIGNIVNELPLGVTRLLAGKQASFL